MKFKSDPTFDVLAEIKQRVRTLRLAGGKPPPIVKRPNVGMKKLPRVRTVPKKQILTKLTTNATPKEVLAPTRIEIPEAPKTVEDKNKPPFSEEEYEHLKQAFIDLDVDGGGDLNMREVSRIPEIVGRKDLIIDRTLFKKMDKDRSGTVDFMEMLRCLYPTASVQVIKAAVAKWSMPDPKKVGKKEAKDEVKDWRRMYTRESLEELEKIFYLYGQEVSSTVWGITKDSLRKQVNTSSMSDDMIDELLLQHGQKLTTDTVKAPPVSYTSEEEYSASSSPISEKGSSNVTQSVATVDTDGDGDDQKQADEPHQLEHEDDHIVKQHRKQKKKKSQKKNRHRHSEANDDHEDDTSTNDHHMQADGKHHIRRASRRTADDEGDEINNMSLTVKNRRTKVKKRNKTDTEEGCDRSQYDSDDPSQDDDDDECVDDVTNDVHQSEQQHVADPSDDLTADLTYISLDSFASIMELTYTTDENSSKAPQLYFQRRDGPTFPLSLPRV